MRRVVVRALAGSILAATLGACAASGSPAPSASASPGAASPGDPTTDQLAHILERGTLVAYYEPEYPPLSYLVDGATRPADTRCAANQVTATEVAGYDADTTKVVAAGLGVEACFTFASWTEVTGGNWGGRFDIAYGSGSINTDRMERLYMTQPYYSVDNYFYVRTDSTYEAPAELSGRTIGVCASCSHEYYLKGELVIPGVEIVQLVEDPEIVPYEIETAGLQELADGGIEAFLCAGVTGQQAIDDGLALRALEPSAFVYYPSGFVDRSSGYDPVAFLERVDAIISAAHADGTLRDLSIEYFGTDLAAKAAAFDLHSIGQVVP